MKGEALLPGNKALTEFLELHVWSPNHSMTRVRGDTNQKNESSQVGLLNRCSESKR